MDEIEKAKVRCEKYQECSNTGCPHWPAHDEVVLGRHKCTDLGNCTRHGEKIKCIPVE